MFRHTIKLIILRHGGPDNKLLDNELLDNKLIPIHFNKNNSKMRVILVCGYRRTGKDTLYHKLSHPNETQLFNWQVYRPSNSSNNLNLDHSPVRLAFADILKEEASEKYQIPLVISDADKDIKQFIHYQTGEMVSARDIYIEWGAIRRKEDPNYWCKVAFESIDNESCVIVTDWRFENEIAYAQSKFDDVVTIRLYRSDIDEPDITIESEHNLDTYLTDLLLVKDEADFNVAIQKFPQYREYTLTGSI